MTALNPTNPAAMSNPDETRLPFADLIEQWERREQTARKLASDAAGAGDWTTEQRCKTKAGVIRSMVDELKREIQNQPKTDEWMPIETAPKDGAMIDLWCVDPDGEFIPESGGIRLTDCAWRESDEIFRHTGWIRVLPDGDFSFIEGPALNAIDLPAWKPTHWRPLPSQPGNTPDMPR